MTAFELSKLIMAFSSLKNEEKSFAVGTFIGKIVYKEGPESQTLKLLGDAIITAKVNLDPSRRNTVSVKED